MTYPPQQPSQPGWAQQPPQAPPPKKTSAGKIVGLGCLGLVGLVGLFIVIAAVGAATSKSSPSTTQKTVAAPPAASTSASVPANSQAAPPPPASSPAAPPPPASSPAAPAAPATVLTLKGNGIKNSPQFTTGDNWTINYTYDCSDFGMKGNFQIYVDYPGGDIPVNELGSKGASSSAETGSGSHSLKINSECAWTVEVVNG